MVNVKSCFQVNKIKTQATLHACVHITISCETKSSYKLGVLSTRLENNGHSNTNESITYFKTGTWITHTVYVQVEWHTAIKQHTLTASYFGTRELCLSAFLFTHSTRLVLWLLAPSQTVATLCPLFVCAILQQPLVLGDNKAMLK